MVEPAASTAYGPMVLVALEEMMPDENRIIHDPFAYKMLPLYMKLMVKACTLKPIRNLFLKAMDNRMPGLRSSFPARKRYVNDKTLESIHSGVQSLVIMGAGLDTLAYRIPELAHLQVYEIDLPENIAYKTRKLMHIFGEIPANITLIPVHFERQKLDDLLIQHGYSFNEQTLFVWEAVTQYLTAKAMRDTFGVLAKACSGSRLVFTYVLKEFIDGNNTYGLDGLYERFCVQDRVWHFGIHENAVSDFIGQYGWRELEQAGADEFIKWYLLPASRTEAVAIIERAVYAEKTSE